MNLSSKRVICARNARQAATVRFLSAAVEVNARYWSLIIEGVMDAGLCEPNPELDPPTDDCGERGTFPISLPLLPGDKGSEDIDREPDDFCS